MSPPACQWRPNCFISVMEFLDVVIRGDPGVAAAKRSSSVLVSLLAGRSLADANVHLLKPASTRAGGAPHKRTLDTRNPAGELNHPPRRRVGLPRQRRKQLSGNGSVDKMGAAGQLAS